jgi:hypothetical protein
MSATSGSRNEGRKAGRSTRQDSARNSVSRTEADRQAAIAVRAYFLAERRGFEHGHELDDWLDAERLEGEVH